MTGQDGSYLSELLLAEGYDVVGVSRRTSTPNDTRIRHLKDDRCFTLVSGDVTDAFSVFRLITDHDPDEVYNLAAQSHVGISFDQPGHTWDATAKGCLNILEAIRMSSRPLGIRFYQASSSEMFGSNYSSRWYPKDKAKWDSCHAQVGLVAPSYTKMVFDNSGYTEERYQDESTPFAPNSPYAVAKLAAHSLVRVYRESYGLHASSGILFNHESERRGDNFVTRKITKYIARVAQQREHGGPSVEPLRLGNLEARRDWGHAEDYVRAMLEMVSQEKPDDYVVATGETHTVREFLLMAFAAIGIDLNSEAWFDRYIHIDKSLYRPSEVPYLRGDASKARSVLGWQPNVTFEGLVRRMVLSDLEAVGVPLPPVRVSDR